MNRDYFWLSEAQFARVAPHLPTDTRGKPRVDDRRVISGIVQVLVGGGSMRLVSTDLGRRSTIATSAGQRRACGSSCSKHSPAPVDHQRTFSSTVRR